MRLVPLVLLVSLGLTRPAHAQSTPEAAAEAFGGAIIANDWPGAARLMHPDALRVFRGLVETFLDEPGAEDVTRQLFGVGSTAELAATPDTVLFARLLKNAVASTPAASMLSGASIKALGHLDQPGDTTLVVSRMTLPIDSLSITSYDLIPVLPYQGGYRTLLKADLTNLLTLLRARLARSS